MNILQNNKEKYLVKIESLKQINDNPEKIFNLNSKYLDTSVKDIFTELVEVAENLLMNSTVSNSNSINTIKDHAFNALDKTSFILKDVLLGNIKKSFFVEEGLCGTETEVQLSSLRIKPKEFDYLEMFKINPENGVGRIIYETPDDMKEKVNRGFYGTFSGSTYTFKNISNETLFEAEWDVNTQEFIIDLHQINVRQFLDSYYSSISYPTLKDILKRNLTVTLKDNTSTNKKTISLDKILDKIFKNCNNKNDDDSENSQSHIGIHEDFEDISGLFNFNEVEGFYLDPENDPYNNVLKFSTCYDIEIPTKKNIIDEVIYFDTISGSGGTETITFPKILDDAIDKVALHSEINTGHTISLPNIKIAFLKDFILNLPKVLMHTIFSPKYIFPIVLFYKFLRNKINEIDIKEVFNELKKLFVKIILSIFWKFVNEFWKLLKDSIVKTLKKLTAKFLKNKLNRYLAIVTSLISILKKIPKDQFKNCNSIYSLIISTINTLMNSSMRGSVPNPLLLMSDSLSGYSQDRSFLNIVELLNSKGISTNPIYGEDNNLLKIVSSIIDGHTKEMDENSFVKIVLKSGTIPVTGTAAVIPPGIIGGTGKIF